MRDFASHMSRERHPAAILLEESDPTTRSAAHVELGRRAMARNDRQLAEDHFREAMDLTPDDAAARHALRTLGLQPGGDVRRMGLRGMFGGWLKPAE